MTHQAIPGRSLADLGKGRDNALDHLRLVAALLVLVSHAWPITGGPGTPEPLQTLTGQTMGTLAVWVFFGLSGFLVTLSFVRAPVARTFVLRRARRLVPGFLVSLLILVFVLGPLVTDRATPGYFSDPETWFFLAWNGSFAGFRGVLPGVFADNPYPAVAGSIWTLSYEVLCYCGVLALGTAGLLRRGRGTVIVLAAVVCAVIIGESAGDLPGRIRHIAVLGVPFGLGMLLCLWRDQIRVSAARGLVVCVLPVLLAGTVLYDLALAFALVYGALVLGSVPVPGRWQLPADLSYGVYIYAFPVQGLVIWWVGADTPMSPWANIALSLPIVLVAATLSWCLVERPFLRPAGPRKRVAAHRGAA